MIREDAWNFFISKMIWICFTNGSGYTELGSNSVINDTNVTLVWVLQGMYELSFKGIINNDFDSMEGNFYTLDLKVGTWEATKLVN
ncbi:hypothetical protein ES708_28012 [subsurface metagenome]